MRGPAPPLVAYSHVGSHSRAEAGPTTADREEGEEVITAEEMRADAETESDQQPMQRLELTGGRRLCLLDGQPLAYIAPVPNHGGHRWACKCGREYLEVAADAAESER